MTRRRTRRGTLSQLHATVALAVVGTTAALASERASAASRATASFLPTTGAAPAAPKRSAGSHHATSAAAARAWRLPSIGVEGVDASALERLRAECAQDSWWLELAGRFVCPLPLGRVGAALPGAGEGAPLLTDPDVSHYRVARGRSLPGSLEHAVVGGDGDIRLLYVPPAASGGAAGAPDLERRAWDILDDAPALERLVDASWAKDGDRAFSGVFELAGASTLPCGRGPLPPAVASCAPARLPAAVLLFPDAALPPLAGNGANTVMKGDLERLVEGPGAQEDAPRDRQLAAIAAAVSGERLHARLNKLTKLPSRHVGHDSYPEAFAFMRAQFAAIKGLTIHPETDAEGGGNGWINPDGPEDDLEREGQGKDGEGEGGEGKEDLERSGRHNALLGMERGDWGTRNVVATLKGRNPELPAVLARRQ